MTAQGYERCAACDTTRLWSAGRLVSPNRTCDVLWIATTPGAATAQQRPHHREEDGEHHGDASDIRPITLDGKNGQNGARPGACTREQAAASRARARAAG